MYLAGRSNLKLAGKLYRLGDPVDLTNVPIRKIGSLARLGLLVEKPAVEVPESQQSSVKLDDRVAGSDDLCAICGAGPFRNMKMHVSKMHKEEKPDG